MEVAFFVLGIVAILGCFSLYQNGQKNKVIMKVIQDYLTTNNSKLVKVEIPQDSGYSYWGVPHPFEQNV